MKNEGELKLHKTDSALGGVYSWASMITVAAVCLFIVFTVAYYGHEVLSFRFISAEPNSSAIDSETGGILTPIIGTLLLTVIGIAVAYPFSLSTAIFLTFYSKNKRLTGIIRTAIDILSGVPTIVIALFALAVFTNPAFSFLSAKVGNSAAAAKAYGKSFFVAGITMAIMILPFVIKSMEEALKVVPASYIEGSTALGASKWRTVTKVALKDARAGLTTGAILGMGRIIGDTAIVWLTLGGTLRMTGLQPWYQPSNWLSTLRNTGGTLTTYIYYTSPAGEGNNYTVAFGASCILILLIIALNAFMTVIGGKKQTSVRGSR